MSSLAWASWNAAAMHPGQADLAQSWTKVSSEEGGYNVQFPAAPRKRVIRISGRTIFESAADLSGNTFLPTHEDRASDLASTAKQWVDAERQSIARQGGKVTAEETITVGGYEGMELRGTLPAGSRDDRPGVVGTPTGIA